MQKDHYRRAGAVELVLKAAALNGDEVHCREL